MQLPLAFLDVAAIEEVPLDLWKEVFQVTGCPPSLAAKRTSFIHDDLVNAFQRDELTDHLMQALETLDTLGNEAGREAIVAAMTDRGLSMDTLPKDMGVREMALRLFLAQQNDASMADVFARAHIQVQDGADQKRYNDFMGKQAKPLTKLTSKRPVLRDRVLQYCQESDLGDHVEVRAFEDDNAHIFSVIRSHRMRKPLAVVPGHDARATIQYRPVHTDMLRYEGAIGRLRIAVRAASMVEFYRRAMGDVLFDDETFFEGDPACNLDILQERGRAVLNNHNVPGVGQIRMTECLWERGEQQLVFRGADCFRSIEELHLPLSEGKIVQAKFKVQVAGKSMRPVTVNIRVPSRIEISRKSQEHLIERVFKAIGIRNANSKSPAVDLWSVQPLRQPMAVWRTLFGSELSGMIQQGVLETVQLDAIAHPEHPAAGRVLEAQPTDDSDSYAVSRMPEIPSRTVSATDLDGLELHPEKLRLYVRSKLEITEGGTIWDGHELLDLGTMLVGDTRIHLTYALRPPTAGIGDRIRARSNGSPAVLLIPASQTSNSDLAKVALHSPVPKRADVLRGAISACALNAVPALHTAPDGARLVVDGKLQRVWVDGVEIEGLAPDSHPFRFMELLGKRSPERVPGTEIAKLLSASREYDDTTARQAKNDARKLIKRAMTKAGRPFEEDIFPTAGTGFYRCNVHSHVP